MGFDGGLDSYAVESFAGPLKVFDVSHLPFGRTAGKDVTGFWLTCNDLPARLVIFLRIYIKAPVRNSTRARQQNRKARLPAFPGEILAQRAWRYGAALRVPA